MRRGLDSRTADLPVRGNRHTPPLQRTARQRADLPVRGNRHTPPLQRTARQRPDDRVDFGVVMAARADAFHQNSQRVSLSAGLRRSFAPRICAAVARLRRAPDMAAKSTIRRPPAGRPGTTVKPVGRRSSGCGNSSPAPAGEGGETTEDQGCDPHRGSPFKRISFSR